MLNLFKKILFYTVRFAGVTIFLICICGIGLLVFMGWIAGFIY
jgi:hypothetical protein